MKISALAAALALVPLPGFAELAVCNETDTTASVAIGYKDTEGWTSEGWWNVEVGGCTTVIAGDLPLSHYYWRAESGGKNREHAQFMFCTSGDAFTIVGDENCDARGYDRKGFNEIALDGATAHTMTLTDAETGSNTGQKSSAAVSDPVPPVPEVDGGLYASAVFQKPDNGPGTYGEPFSIVGRFKGCWAEAEVLECEVRAEGWRYIVSDLGPTDIAIIDGLNQTPTGAQIQLSGDMIFYEGDRADITVRRYEVIGAAAAPASTVSALGMDGLMQHLQGYWQSDDGSGYGWAIEGNQLRLILDANIAEIYNFQLHPQCAASDGRGPVIIGYPEIEPSMGPACFLVTEAAQRHLAVEDVVEGQYISFSYVN